MNACDSDRGHMHTPDMGDPEGETLPEESEVFEVDEQISEKIQELKNGTVREAVLAAEFLFARAHTSHHKAEENKQQIRREGAISHLCRLLTETSIEARYQACSALSELAFRNERNCIGIQHAGGRRSCAEQLCCILRGRMPDHGAIQGAGARAEEACGWAGDGCKECSCGRDQLSVAMPGSFPLPVLLSCNTITGPDRVSAQAAKDILMSYRIVEEALTPVLRETGSKHLPAHSRCDFRDLDRHVREQAAATSTRPG
eukprot:1581018-Rhodomonas_salina.1